MINLLKSFVFFVFKNNIQQAYQELIVLIRDQYSEEDLQIIGCPSQEQVQENFLSKINIDLLYF